MEPSPAGRFGTDAADAARSHDRAHARVMAHAGAWLYGAGASLGLLWLVLPHPLESDPIGLVVVLTVSYAFAGVLWFRGERWPPLAFDATVAGGTVLVTAAIEFTGATTSPFVLFYLWCNLY